MTVHATRRAADDEAVVAALNRLPGAAAHLHWFEADLAAPSSLDAAMAGCKWVLAGCGILAGGSGGRQPGRAITRCLRCRGLVLAPARLVSVGLPPCPPPRLSHHTYLRAAGTWCTAQAWWRTACRSGVATRGSSSRPSRAWRTCWALWSAHPPWSEVGCGKSDRRKRRLAGKAAPCSLCALTFKPQPAAFFTSALLPRPTCASRPHPAPSCSRPRAAACHVFIHPPSCPLL